MSRFCGEKVTGPILDAAETWRDKCLLGREGLLGLDSVWREEYLAELDQYYVQNLDWGEGNFLGKLSSQLSPATPQAKILAAEIMWVMMLCPSNISPDKKIENIQTIYEWSGQKLDLNHPLLQSAPLLGIGSAGTAYNNLRWRELRYFIQFLQAFFSESEEVRKSLMSDGLRFSEWLEQLPENDQRQLRHMFLFLLFPDQFERIFGKSDRIKCVLAFSDVSKSSIKKMSARELDEKLASARARLEAEYETDKLDWYVPPLRAFWQKTSKTGEIESGSFFETLERFIEQSNSGELATRAYPNKYEGLEVRVSFGQGNQAHVTWVAFLGPGQAPTKGIYPVYLYYKAKKLLILSRGISATHTPGLAWTGQNLQSISSYFNQHYGEDAIKYGDSYVYGVYDLSDELDPIAVEEDLSELIAEYKTVLEMVEDEPDPGVEEPEPVSGPVSKFSVEEAMEGLFLEDHKVQQILQLLRSKKNIILQGPPGVGKTFVCRRIAFALMGARDLDRLGMVQFHQSYSYEDFVQGYRPSGSGFSLKDGVFHQFCSRAQRDPANDYVFIIDEINRGNLSKIFGELMMLVENDKRGEDFAVPLTYAESENDRFYVPSNLYLVGLMNTADRSLAMVDYALRRRFAFVDLSPAFSSQKFRDYLAGEGAPQELIQRITSRMGNLNNLIAADKTDLGPGFCIGHSFFCTAPIDGEYDTSWYESIVRSEIVPLINEYWFDDPSKAESIIGELLAP